MNALRGLLYFFAAALLACIVVGFPIAWYIDGPPPWVMWPQAALWFTVAVACLVLARHRV